MQKNSAEAIAANYKEKRTNYGTDILSIINTTLYLAHLN